MMPTIPGYTPADAILLQAMAQKAGRLDTNQPRLAVSVLDRAPVAQQPSAEHWQANSPLVSTLTTPASLSASTPPAPATTTAMPPEASTAPVSTQTTSPPVVSATSPAPAPVMPLKDWLQHGQAVIYALNLRTFGAEDKNGDGHISPQLGESGGFLSAIKRLPELKAEGFNTIHLLPVTAIGESPRLGEAGSLYAPASYTDLNPQFDQPGNNLTPMQEMKQLVDAAHEQGMAVMVDLPSCASYDLAASRPDLIAKDDEGKPLTPTNWVDVVMMKRDTPEMREYFNQFCQKMTQEAGVDGFRCDIARARTPEFWQDLTARYPEHGWFAESYIEEDDSPLKNLPRDYPTDLLKSGFDSFYGQFHIFYNMTGKEYTDYLGNTWDTLKNMPQPKAMTGTFYTHDDHSLMEHGGAPMVRLALAMEALQPFSNQYVMDGLLTGDPNTYDIFDYRPAAIGKNPELTDFYKSMNEIRVNHPDQTGPTSSFTAIPVTGTSAEHPIVAYTRNGENGQSLLVIANKDLNEPQKGVLNIPGLTPEQGLSRDLVAHDQFPNTGEGSTMKVYDPDQLTVELAPAAIHVFEINGQRVTSELPTQQPWHPPSEVAEANPSETATPVRPSSVPANNIVPVGKPLQLATDKPPVRQATPV